MDNDIKTDAEIVELYRKKDERAIYYSATKYGKMLNGISYSLTSSRQDAEECVNDAYMAAWNNIPPETPKYLGAYLAKITRRLSVDRFRAAHRRKRGGCDILLDELSESIPDGFDLEKDFDNTRLRKALDEFIGSLDDEKRNIFVKRYFYAAPLRDIAYETGASEGKIKSVLFRLRQKLRETLEKEGILP